ncbi:hypothetical protein FSP39_008440 [Pinctada imbricata]|uniref:Microtubule-associated protein futsch n=1 Tax=Pinctada imbricata TaxID=66713 RepID=A0AA88Y3V0_PINIB|nr:hypothetical protein FSP39_008440 [Pinctada imbricata]
MESEVDGSQSAPGSDGGPGTCSTGALLVVIGEPFSEDHKQLILADVTNGFKCWSCDSIDINEELAHIANRADVGEEGTEGERILRYRSDGLAVEILVNPRCQTLTQSLRVFLSSPTTYKHLIYAGHYFSGSGAWVLQDDVFTVSKMVQIFKDADVETSLKQIPDVNLILHLGAASEWKSLRNIPGYKDLKVQISPEATLTNLHGTLQFAAYISNFINPLNLSDLLQVTDYVGCLKFVKPTIYIFPGCEGDSALFVINGFNLLVNGGFRRKPCFWNISRHLDRIDAMLLTHLGSDNLFGVSAMLQRKALGNIHPQLGYLFMNSIDKLPSPPPENGEKKPSLCINLAEEGSKLVDYAKQMGLSPYPCLRQATGPQITPINLYLKVGYGSLDMYILNPVSDTKELKDFHQQWNKHVAEFGISQSLPLPSLLSVCALLVWKPANPNEKINRIFFPGNAPQHKIIEGLEKLKHLDFLKHPSCSAKDLQAKPLKKATTTGRPSLGGKAPGRPLSARTEAHKQVTEKKELTSRPKPDSNKTNDTKAKNGTPETKSSAASLKKPTLNKKPKAPPTDTKSSKPDEKPKPQAASTTKTATPTKASTPRKETPEKKSLTNSAKKPTTNGKSTKASSPVKATETKPKESPTKPAEVPIEAPKEEKPAENSLISISPEEVPLQQEPVKEENKEPIDLNSDLNQFDAPPVSSAPLDPFEMLDTKPEQMDMLKNDLQQDLLMPEKNGSDKPNEIDALGDVVEKPQSLPDPVAFPAQEPDLIPDTEPVKDVSPEPEHNTEALPDPDVVPSTKASDPDLLVGGAKEEIEDDEKRGLDEELTEGFEHKEEGITHTESRSPILSPVEPDTKSDALDDHDEGDEDEVSPDEADSQGDVGELTTSQTEEIGDISGVSPSAYDNMGFVDSLNEGKDGEPKEIEREPSEEKDEVEDEEDEDEGIGKDTMEASHIPEAFEKDVTPDPPELQDPHDDIVPKNTLNIDPREQYVANDQPLDSINEEGEENEGGFSMRMDGGLNPFNGLDQAQIPSAHTDQQQFQDPFSIGGPGQGFTFGHVGQTAPSQQPYARQIPCQEGYDPYEDEEDGEMQEQEFNPDSEWGKPMGLPSPLPPEEKEASSGPTKKNITNGKATNNEKSQTNKAAANPKGAMAAKKTTTSTTSTSKATEKEKSNKSSVTKTTKNSTVTKSETTTKGEKLNTSRVETTTKTTTQKSRPSTAGGISEPKTKPPHRPATATGSSRSSPATSKMPSLPPHTSFYVDLAYIPHHGDPAYCDVEYFKRVRARYYIYSSQSPNPVTLNALVEAKQTWEDKDLQVTLYPTYDNDTLRHWMALNEQKLHDVKIEVAASVSRCILQLQDSDTSCQALRLELSDGAE